MKISSPIYRIVTKATALLLLLAILIPAGLQAKQLVDFCMMEMGDHQHGMMAEMNHDCCDSQLLETIESGHQHHDCDRNIICSCDLEINAFGDNEWIIGQDDYGFVLSVTRQLPPHINSDERINHDLGKRIGQYDPPLWLLYDTFLM